MSVRAKASARCVICGSKAVEQNHVGGRNHVAWFTMPFCREHHAQFHGLLRAAGIDPEYTPDPIERGLRALEACWVADWVIVQSLRKHLSELRVRSHG
jgi:hypothetical protein